MTFFRNFALALGLFTSTLALAADVKPVFRIKKAKPSLAVVALKAWSPSDVRFVWQIGLQAMKESQTIQIAPETGLEFWKNGKLITTSQLRALSAAKKFRVFPKATTWLPIFAPIVKGGGLLALPALSFNIDGFAFASLLPPGVGVDDRDLIRNEYVAAAAQFRNTAVAWKAYGPRWTKPIGRVTELFADSDFSAVADAENPDVVDHTISDWQGVKSRGCDVGNSSGDYAYKYFLDIDHRLSRATAAVTKAVVEHFFLRSRSVANAPDKEEIAKLFRISSGYRNPARNRCVGGVPFSRHQLGSALDLSFTPNSGAASQVASRLGMDIGKLWREYMTVAAKAVTLNSRITPKCMASRIGTAQNPRSKFSAFPVECGCEGSSGFLNCSDDAPYVNHVHLGF